MVTNPLSASFPVIPQFILPILSPPKFHKQTHTTYSNLWNFFLNHEGFITWSMRSTIQSPPYKKVKYYMNELFLSGKIFMWIKKHNIPNLIYFISVHQMIIQSTQKTINAHMWIVFSTCYSLPTCFICCCSHHQGNLKDYNMSKWTVKMHKWNTHCYKECLRLPT